MNITPALSNRQGLSKKLIMGFTALAGAAVVGTIGMVNAAPSMDDKPLANSAFCNKFKNYGQCVQEWAKDKDIPKEEIPEVPADLVGYGGGSANIATDTNIEANASVEGDNNVVQFFVNVYNTINVFN